METTKQPSPYCQLHTIPKMSGGLVDLGFMPLRRRVKLWLKRTLGARTKRRLKRMTITLQNWFLSKFHRQETEIPMKNQRTFPDDMRQVASAVPEFGIKAGDLIRVRSRAEIEATLDRWNELKHCAVMPDMWQYCETVQRVFKVVEQFVDERDYRLKKGTGTILLEGLICQGTDDYGRCDRSCFYFWRVEWLEKAVKQRMLNHE